jgi:hypothetical protein
MGKGEFRDEEEFRTVLDGLFEALATHPQIGPDLREARFPHRFEFPDYSATLDLQGASEEDAAQGRHLIWTWGGSDGFAPEITLRMRSDVANRLWQGKLNPMLAVATGKIRVGGDMGKAARLAPLIRPVPPLYRALLEERGYSHLIV